MGSPLAPAYACRTVGGLAGRWMDRDCLVSDVRRCSLTSDIRHSTSTDVYSGFLVLSTLFPITPPRMPPTAAPIKPPFTLLRLVVAPRTAPAAAPIAASRWVCFTTVGAGCEYTVPPLVPDEYVPAE